MIEVEVKLPAADLDSIKEKLLKTGFKENAFIEEHDTYFDNEQGDIRANGEALRVRETKNNLTGKSRAQINFKGKKLDAHTMTREELETGVENGAVCRKILQAIGYMPAEPEVIKDGTMLRKESVTACLDDVHGLGRFLELEILADSEEKKDAALGKIEDILNQCHLDKIKKECKDKETAFSKCHLEELKTIRSYKLMEKGKDCMTKKQVYICF